MAQMNDGGKVFSSGFLRVKKDNISNMAKHTKELQDCLQETYRMSKRIYDSITPNLWSGKSKDEFMVFYHLLLQYHGCLAGLNTPGNNQLGRGYTIKSDYLAEMEKALSGFYDDLCRFQTSNSNYKNMKGMK